LLIVCFVCRSM